MAQRCQFTMYLHYAMCFTFYPPDHLKGGLLLFRIRKQRSERLSNLFKVHSKLQNLGFHSGCLTLKPVFFPSLHTHCPQKILPSPPHGNSLCQEFPPPQPIPTIPGLYLTIFSISWTLRQLFQLPGKSVSVDTPVLNSTLHDLQTSQGHQNKAISSVPSLSSQSKLFCLILRQLIDQVMGSEVFF